VSEPRLVLGIETSCDETSVAVVEHGTRVLSNVIASQVELHAKYGGVVPEIASRKHLETILPAMSEAVSGAGIRDKDIDAVAVTCGPGLAGALLVGVMFGKAFAFGRDIALIGVNHLEGHIFANFLEREDGKRPEFPLVCLVVSGGHTDLIHMQSEHSMTVLGRTRDDAAGEAFDKVARLLDLGYPGGPLIDRLAEKGDPEAVKFPRAYLEEGSYDFSFSGLKTAVRHVVEAGEASKQDIAASFQRAVSCVLVDKAFSCVERTRSKMLMFAGGVSANSEIRRAALKRAAAERVSLLIPPAVLCTDNAAMIAARGHHLLSHGFRSGWDLNAYPALMLGTSPRGGRA